MQLGHRIKETLIKMGGGEIGPYHTCDTPAEYRARNASKEYFRKLRSDTPKEEIDPNNKARIAYRIFKKAWNAKGLVWSNKVERLAVSIIAVGTQSPRAAKFAGVELRKGLYIFGGVGTGKTTAVQLAMQLNILPGKLASCIEMRKEASKEGQEALDRYEGGTWAFDDLGQEGECNHYGTKIYPVQDVCFTRYRNFQSAGKLTHFTSNLHPSQLAEIYDMRFIDRLKEMCNFISHDGESYRK